MKITFLGKAKLTTQGQITLPHEGRRELEVSSGDEVYWYKVDNFIILTKTLHSHDDLLKIVKKSMRGE